nr:hypothetical protein [Tanacetum cinerariifolium]
MAVPPSPNHVFNFHEDEPYDFDDFNFEFEEDPQEESEEEPEEDPEEELEEALEIEVDDKADWDEKLNEPELIFPYEEVGFPKPPPPESSDSEKEMIAEEMVQDGVVGVRPGQATDVLAVYEEFQPRKP